MKSRLVLAAVLAFPVISGAAADEYDFFSGARYPGAERKPGVDVYRVKQDGGPFATGYQRRVVDWWPRKGVDIIEVKDAMPLRTWTLRERKMDPHAVGVHLILGIEELTRRVAWGRRLKFEARLIGFRGIGNRYGNLFEPARFYCPGVVLLMEDGTKRCFTRGTIVERDEKFILDLYLKEIARVRKTLSKEEYEVGSGVKREWPDNAKPGRPGTMRVESEHFVWVSGSQHAPNEVYSPWVNRDEPEKARLYRRGSVAFAEDMWAYQAHAGVLMPFWDRTERRKHAITVCGTYRDGHKWLGGYAGGGYGGCGVKFAGGGPWGLTLAHEWGHGLPLQLPVGAGGGETLADACSSVCDPAAQVYYNNARRPWRNCVHGSYGTCLLYAMAGDDPNWGYAMVITLPAGRREKSVFHTLARVGEQRGMFANGIRGVGDMIGEFSARQAEFDCEIRETLRRDHISVKRNYLEAVDRKKGIYRIPWGESPEMFGANIIRLLPEKEASKIKVDFRGFYDDETFGDWRACIVVVGETGKIRYSPMWNKGVMEMAVKSTDRRFWLTVAATPRALPPAGEGGRIGAIMTGRHACRYPYEVTLTHCRPGTPHNLPGDVEDYSLTYIGGFRDRFSGGLCVIPHPGDTPEAKIIAREVPPLRAKVDEVKNATRRFVADEKIDTKHWRYLRRFVPHLKFLDDYVGLMLDGIRGGRHPNGGGWVSASAEVAPSAYVAPDAMVLRGAKVLDNAAIEDYAVVKGPKTVVYGNAKISGQAHVSGNVEIGGYTRVVHPVIADRRKVVPNEVPLRPAQEKDDGEKLWANYSMDRDESEVLEDYFRYQGRGGGFYVLNLNGHLYGRPRFVVDAGRRGFVFDGKTQYAEASPILADLGQITIDIALKWEGGDDQAIFDFGTSKDNRFVLGPAGASGKIELAITREGKTETLIADTAMPTGKWARCRVEIDGKKIAVRIDGTKVAEKASSFRPADAYPPGVEKRNFIAATREARGHFKGTIDYLRVYYAVYDDFNKAPPPRRHAPRKVTREFIDTCSKLYEGTREKRDKLIREKVEPELVYYKQLGKRRDELLKEIESAAAKATAEEGGRLDAIKKELDKRTGKLKADFDKLPETIGQREESRKLEEKARQLDKQRSEAIKAIRAKYGTENKTAIEAETARRKSGVKFPGGYKTHRQRVDELVRNDRKITALRREIDKLRARGRKLRPDPRDYINERTVELRRRLTQADIAAREARRKCIAKFKPEYDWLSSLGWMVFSGHYNYPYRSYFRQQASRTIGGKVCHENFGALEGCIGLQRTEKWHRKCDWDWRLRQEIDGSIADLPMLKKWIERARGKTRK